MRRRLSFDAERIVRLIAVATLNKLLPEKMLENEVARDALQKKVASAPARRELVHPSRIANAVHASALARA